MEISELSKSTLNKFLGTRERGSPSFISNEIQEQDSQEVTNSNWTQEARPTSEDYNWALPLIKAMERDDWKSFKTQFDKHQSAETRIVNSRGGNFLHLATETGNLSFVRDLVRLMSPADLELKDGNGDQALIYAATGGIKEIGEILVGKNSNLACIENQHGLLPVVIAAKNGNKDICQYLYSKTPRQKLSPETGKNGVRLVIAAVVSDMHDIALDLLQYYPKLAIACDNHERNVATALAERPSAFPSGCLDGIIEGIIYRGAPVLNVSKYPEKEMGCFRDGITVRICTMNLVKYSLHQFIWTVLKHISVPGFNIKEIYRVKLIHIKTLQLLKIIANQLSSLSEVQLERAQAYKAINEASKFGIVEMVSELIKCNPNLQFSTDMERRDIFQIAAMHRQENVFNLIYEMRNTKMIAVRGDKSFNNLLHTVGSKTSSSQLNRISGAALQMQRELQWFQEVERLVPPRFKEEKNRNKETPGEVFTKNHKNMVREGEDWMKATSQGCMVVAALIATVMFTAAFTVPGGVNSETGFPVFIKTKLFMVFIITDALSLFSSCSSMLMFLAILTSRYAEQDFLLSLPRKLILGLTTLFFSIATMMAAFCATLFIVLGERSTWVAMLCTLLAGVPVSLFVMLQFPLLVSMIYSTYGPSIFGKRNKANSS